MLVQSHEADPVDLGSRRRRGPQRLDPVASGWTCRHRLWCCGKRFCCVFGAASLEGGEVANQLGDELSALWESLDVPPKRERVARWPSNSAPTMSLPRAGSQILVFTHGCRCALEPPKTSGKIDDKIQLHKSIGWELSCLMSIMTSCHHVSPILY